MAWNKNKLKLHDMLVYDIIDWYLVHPSIQSAILDWIIEDRKHQIKESEE